MQLQLSSLEGGRQRSDADRRGKGNGTSEAEMGVRWP